MTLSDEQLAEIRARFERAVGPHIAGDGQPYISFGDWEKSARDVPILLDEVDRLNNVGLDTAMNIEGRYRLRLAEREAELARIRGDLEDVLTWSSWGVVDAGRVRRTLEGRYERRTDG